MVSPALLSDRPPVFEDRNLRLDLFALLLLAFAIFLAVALFSYDPADPIGELIRPLNRLYQQDILVYPMHQRVTNACGWSGALAADLLLNAVGCGAYFVVLSLAALDVMLLCRQEIDTPVLRLSGWITSIFGLVTLAAILVPYLSPGPVIGSGGYLGALGRGILETHFAFVGTLILAGSVFLGGLLLCTDYALVRFTWGSLRLAGRALPRRRRMQAKQAVSRGVQNETAELTKPALEGAQDEAADENEKQDSAVAVPGALSVKVRGKPQAEVDGDSAGHRNEPEDSGEDLAALQEEPEAVEEPAGQQADEPQTPVRKREKSKQRGVASRPHFRVKSKFDKQQRAEVMSKLDAASTEDPGEYELPSIDLLTEGDDLCFDEQVKEVRCKAKILERTFANFGFQVKVVEIETGPVIAQYEVELEAGLRLSKITGLADDLAIALRVPSVRIVAPIPGKNTVGIEVPNEARQVVRLREVIEETNGTARKMKIPLFLGKDVSGKPLAVDLATLPHLLIAGRTGTGKSVCLNAIISSILMTKKPDEVRLLLIDPKMVELSGYGRLPHLMHPVVTDMRKAEAILAWAVEKMEERYSLLARAGVRHISNYNQLGDEEIRRRLKPESEEEWEAIPNHLPYIVIVADEMADLMMTAGKEAEQHIIRLAQKSRAVGIHLILATQKPTVDVITGLIKSNLPARISFQVASRTDSRVVLDEMGADRLLGNGDMLFLWPGTSTLVRGQGTYLSDEEIEQVVDCVSTGEQNFVNELVNLKVAEPEGESPGPLKKRDELYEGAVDIVVREGRGSVSLLQRTLGVGYGRAARLIDYMAEDGIVGPYAGSQAREVQISLTDWETMQGAGETVPAATAPAAIGTRRRSNKVSPVPQGDDERTSGESDESANKLESEGVDAREDEDEYEGDGKNEQIDEDLDLFDDGEDDDDEEEEEEEKEEAETDSEHGLWDKDDYDQRYEAESA